MPHLHHATDATKPPERNSRVPAVGRAAAVITAVANAGRPMALSELTKLTGFPKSSVMGVCYALAEERLLTRGVDGSYALGPRVFEFGAASRVHGEPLLNVGFTYPDDESFFVAEIRALRSEAATIGARAHVRSSHQDKARQLAHIAEFVAADVDLVLVEPVVAEGLEVAFADAHAARIPVIALGSPTSGADAVVATNNTKAGALAGAALVRRLSGHGRVAVVGGTPVTANTDRVAGFLGVVAAHHPRMTVVATSHGELDAQSGERAAEEILAAHLTIDGFFATNDQIALGISNVLRREHMFLPIVSVDGARVAVEQIRAGGPIIASAAQDPAALVRAALALGRTLRAAPGGTHQSVYLQPRLIDAQNATAYAPWG